MTAALEKKGIEVNKESLAKRVKNPKRISDLESAQDKKFKKEFGIEGDSDGSDDEMVDDKLNKQENEERTGRKQIRAERKRERSKSLQKKPTTMLGKRAA